MLCTCTSLVPSLPELFNTSRERGEPPVFQCETLKNWEWVWERGHACTINLEILCYETIDFIETVSYHVSAHMYMWLPSITNIFLHTCINTAGQETTALMLTFTIIELGRHPEVRQRSDIITKASTMHPINIEL